MNFQNMLEIRFQDNLKLHEHAWIYTSTLLKIGTIVFVKVTFVFYIFNMNTYTYAYHKQHIRIHNIYICIHM